MMKIKLIFRRLFKLKLNNAVVIVSLTVGIASINLISIFLTKELNTDKFQKDCEQIYALKCDDPFSEARKIYYCLQGSAEYINENFSQVEDFCRINEYSAIKITANRKQYFDNPSIICASKNFFQFFDFNLLTNNKKTALEAENMLVISDKLAKKYFGDSDPVGKTITLANNNKSEELVISGVFKKPNENTQLNFDMVCSSNFRDGRCYIKLIPGTDAEKLEQQFSENKEKIPNIDEQGQYYLEPFYTSYFDTSSQWPFIKNRDKKDLSIALIIGLVILIVALFNYFGLLNISLLEKTKSFTIQRINGSSKLNIALAIMLENIFLFLISVILSLFLVIWISPFFNKLTGTNITSTYFFQLKQILTLLSYITFFLVITFLFILVRVKIAFNTTILKSKLSQTAKRIQLPAFNIFQLASSVVLIICPTVILKQIKYISDKPIGLDKNVIEIKLPKQYANKAAILKEELLCSPFIKQVSVTKASPMQECWKTLLYYQDNGKEKEYTPALFSGDENYISTLDIKLITGENLYPTQDSEIKTCLINKSLANLFPGENLVGKTLPGNSLYKVNGIVKDFNFTDLKQIIEPAFIEYSAEGSNLLIKAKPGQSQQINDLINKTWKNNIPDYPLNIETIGDRFEWKHQENQNYIRLIGSCSFISIFLSVIGLFVISLRSCQSRTKEIGVRKVNGAKTREILALLNSDFIKWVAIAFVISAPVAWYTMNKWLENFAYKTVLSWWIFIFGGLITVIIALFTVSWQSWKAANKNPVEALKYE